MATWQETTRLAVAVLVILGCVAILGGWRSQARDQGPVPAPPGVAGVAGTAPRPR